MTAGLEPDFGVSSQVSSLPAHATSVTGLGLRLTFSYLILLISRDNAPQFVLLDPVILVIFVWCMFEAFGPRWEFPTKRYSSDGPHLPILGKKACFETL